MNKLSARADGAILENDTEKKYRKERNSQISKELNAF